MPAGGAGDHGAGAWFGLWPVFIAILMPFIKSFESTDYYIHRAFGLRYRSRLDWLPLPHALPAGSDFDIDISCGEVPDLLPGAGIHQRVYDIEPGKLLFKTRTHADFLIEGGRSVRMQPKPDSDPLGICNLLFGGVTGALLIQRGVLALHGASVVTPGGAVVFCGPSGAGKSTLALALARRGFAYIDDNIAALDEGFRIQPGIGFMRLTDDSRQMFALTEPALSYATPKAIKYLHSPAGCCLEAQPLRHIFLLDRTQPQLLTPILREQRLDIIRRNTFTPHLIHGLGADNEQFRLAMALAGSVPASLLGYPPEMSFAEWADRIAALIGAC